MTTSRLRFVLAVVALGISALAWSLLAEGGPLRHRVHVPADVSVDTRPATTITPLTKAVADGAPQPVALADELDADNPDAPEVWPDPGLHPLTVIVLNRDQKLLGGIPVVVMGRAENGALLAGPKLTNRDGRVRFPIDVRFEHEYELLVAARAVPGFAASAPVTVTLDKPCDVTLTIDAGLSALVRVLDPEGGVYDGPARVRRIVTEDPATETGPHAERLAAVFRETTPRAVRQGEQFLLWGMRAPDVFTLYVAAPGYEPVFAPVRVPSAVGAAVPIDVKLGARTAVAQFDALLPASINAAEVAYAAHVIDPGGVVVAAGSDEGATQRSPHFDFDVRPGRAARLRVTAYRDGRAEAAGDLDVPSIAAGAVARLGGVKMEALPLVLAGRVFDRDDQPLAGANVEAFGRTDVRDLTAVAGADGAFLLRGLTGRGPYQVSAHLPGRVSQHVANVSEGTRDLRFVLELAGALQGQVLLPPGTAADRVTVRALHDDRSPAVTSLKADGTFLISGLAAGLYLVVVDGVGIRPVRVTDVTVTAGETTRDPRLERVVPRSDQAGQP